MSAPKNIVLGVTGSIAAHKAIDIASNLTKDGFSIHVVMTSDALRFVTPLPFKTPGLYRLVRHPLYVGWFFAFWATPTMTVTHLVFAIATTAYILIAIQLEERDLVEAHPEYESYRRSVPMLVPFTKRRTRTTQSTVSAVQPR